MYTWCTHILFFLLFFHFVYIRIDDIRLGSPCTFCFGPVLWFLLNQTHCQTSFSELLTVGMQLVDINRLSSWVFFFFLFFFSSLFVYYLCSQKYTLLKQYQWTCNFWWSWCRSLQVHDVLRLLDFKQQFKVLPLKDLAKSKNLLVKGSF